MPLSALTLLSLIVLPIKEANLLYNPTWTKDHKPCLDDLISWLATKDPKETYVYRNCAECLAAQYNDSLGRIYYIPRYFFHLGDFDCQMETIARNGESTFGAALIRAKQMNSNWFQRWVG